MEPVGNTSGDGNIFVLSLPERAVEFRVPQVELQAGLLDFSKRQAIHLVPGIRRVVAALALADVRGNRNVEGKQDVDPAAEPLEEVLVHKSRGNQRGIERRQVAQVIVVQAERQQVNRLKPDARKALS